MKGGGQELKGMGEYAWRVGTGVKRDVGVCMKGGDRSVVRNLSRKGAYFFLFQVGAQQPSGPENSLKTIDFTGPGRGLSPHSPHWLRLWKGNKKRGGWITDNQKMCQGNEQNAFVDVPDFSDFAERRVETSNLNIRFFNLNIH